jgi:hypothetical protein
MRTGAGSLGSAAAPFSQICGWKPNAMCFTAFGRVKSANEICLLLHLFVNLEFANKKLALPLNQLCLMVSSPLLTKPYLSTY